MGETLFWLLWEKFDYYRRNFLLIIMGETLVLKSSIVTAQAVYRSAPEKKVWFGP